MSTVPVGSSLRFLFFFFPRSTLEFQFRALPSSFCWRSEFPFHATVHTNNLEGVLYFSLNQTLIIVGNKTYYFSSRTIKYNFFCRHFENCACTRFSFLCSEIEYVLASSAKDKPASQFSGSSAHPGAKNFFIKKI